MTLHRLDIVLRAARRAVGQSISVLVVGACAIARPEPDIIQAGEPASPPEYEAAVSRVEAVQSAESSVVVGALQAPRKSPDKREAPD